MLGGWRRVAPAVAATVLLWGCATPAVETDAPDYSTTGYVYDVSLCNAADFVRNSAKGSIEVVKGMAVGFVAGAALAANNRNNGQGSGEETLSLMLGGALVGTVGGAGYGLYKAIADADLTVDECLEREGFTLANADVPPPI